MAEPATRLAGRPSLRRSITVIPALLDFRPAEATNGVGVFELREERGYTSIRDLIVTTPRAAAIHSPATASPGDGRWYCDIPIRNRLVKQAAQAYLQPMARAAAAAAGSSRWWGKLQRFWEVISCGLTLEFFLDFVRRLFGAI